MQVKTQVEVSHLVWILPALSQFMNKKGLVDIIPSNDFCCHSSKRGSGWNRARRMRRFLCFWFAARPSAAFPVVCFQPQTSEGHSLKSLQGSAINFKKRNSSLDHVRETNTTWVANKRNYYRGDGVICVCLGLPEEDELTRIKRLRVISDWRVWTASLFEKSKQSAPWNVTKLDPCRLDVNYADRR